MDRKNKGITDYCKISNEYARASATQLGQSACSVVRSGQLQDASEKPQKNQE